MPVFYMTYYAKGLKFKTVVGGFEHEYTKKELDDIRQHLIKVAEAKLDELGYIEG